MRVLLITALAIFHGVIVGALTPCSPSKTVTVTPTGIIACPLCIAPTTTCKRGQQSLAPFPTITSACTATVLHECPCTTCLPKTTPCTSTTTVRSRPPFICEIACIPPESTCKPGESTGPAQSVTTTVGCTVSIVGKSCPGCASCVLPTPTGY
ncbi:hypothetical protein G7054_g2723 [Neopestalotiopsis clavispora]|jgi:hypothetical protein|nr:hypothetical protein E8E14_010343 [Neopestalotiopsis sp. 37M]KAF7538719.1 hypothetical protein G7054_g2723 [Neopestalotiopsis clavispora]